MASSRVRSNARRTPAPASLQMRSLLVLPLVQWLRERNVDPDAVLREVGLDPSVAGREPSCMLSLTTLHALFDRAEKAVNDAFLGLHVGERFSRGTFGVVEFACEAAPTVETALRRLSRYHALLNDLVVVTITTERSQVIVDHRISASPLCVGRHPNEFFAANVLVQARRVTGRPFIPRHVFFAHPAPRDVSEHVRLFGTRDLRFGQGGNGVALDPEDFAAPVLTADRPLAEVLDAHAEKLLAAHPKPRRFQDQVRLEVRKRLVDGPPSLVDIAKTLHVAPRTLQRRLGEDGASLLDLVDAERRELACVRVLDKANTMERVAFELGYSDIRAFFRAFKRWTGSTPRRFREEQN